MILQGTSKDPKNSPQERASQWEMALLLFQEAPEMSLSGVASGKKLKVTGRFSIRREVPHPKRFPNNTSSRSFNQDSFPGPSQNDV